MKIVHFSDTHLGFSEFELESDGINQRERDFYNSFIFIIDRITELKPDFVVHSGDLFHKSRPSNRSIAFAFKEFKRLSDAKIKTILIAGNHSTPKESSKISILEAFNELDFIYSVSRDYKLIEFDNVAFHALPHINDKNLLNQRVEELEDNLKDKKNILMAHCSFQKNYLMHEFGEWVFPDDKEELLDRFDYIALGHWHKFKKIRENCYYSGSSERTSAKDRDLKKHFLLVDLKKEIEVTPIEIKIRQNINIDIDLENFESVDEVIEFLKEKTEQTDEHIVNLNLSNLNNQVALDLDNEVLNEHLKSFNMSVKREFQEEKKIEVNFDSIDEMFMEYLLKDSDKLEQDRLRAKANHLFKTFEDRDSDN